MSSSILTNLSAMSAVQNLNNTQQQLSQVQNEISTGLSIGSASDNAAYYSIAQTMRASVSNDSAVSSSLNLGSSVIGSATAALTGMTSILQSIQADLISAQQSGTDKTSIGTEITALQSQLASAVSSASFNNVNLLDGSATAASFVSSVTGTGVNTQVNYMAVNTATTNFGTGTASNFDIALSSNAATGVTASTTSITGTAAFTVSSTTTSQDLTNYIAAIGQALTSVNTASETLGANQKAISLQSNYVSTLSDTVTSGIGSLVDADMNEASTRLNALQTQQQLGVQALSVANQNSQLILKLFQ